MKKLTWKELLSIINQHNKDNNIRSQYSDKNPIQFVIVYKQSNWPNDNYSLLERSYKSRSDNKYFLSEMCGNSLYANSLDGTDINVRLDWYNWEIEYCYLI